MLGMLLDNNIWARFTQVNVVTGLVLLAVGIILALCAGRITKHIRKQEKIESNDKVFITIKAIALAIILASLIVMIIE